MTSPRRALDLDAVPAAPVPVVLALGANLDRPADRLQAAVDGLSNVEGIEIQAVSPVYRTAPVGGPSQDDYLNAVVLARAGLSPRALLHACQSIEAEQGRVRETRWGPRTLDIDLISYGELACYDEELTLPHPRAAQRAFVLAPWADVAPSAVLPGAGPVGHLLEQCAGQRIERTEVTLAGPK